VIWSPQELITGIEMSSMKKEHFLFPGGPAHKLELISVWTY
jgi:hypothetical protein